MSVTESIAVDFITQAWQFSWQPESALVIAMVLGLSLVIGRIVPDTRRRLWNILGFFALTFAGQVVAGFCAVAGYAMAASVLYEVFIIAGGLIIIRLWAMFFFRIVLPLVHLRAPHILEDVIVIIGAIAWCLVRLRYAGADLSGIVATSAVITGVIGFAMQDTLGNIIGGLGIQLDNSVKLGDWLQIDGVSGRVIDIRWRSTSIETRNWETVVIPNSVLMKSRFMILGRRSGEPLYWRRLVLFNVDLGAPPARVIPVIEAAIREAEIDNVARQPPPSCVLFEFEHGYGRYGLRYWLTDLLVDDPTDSTVRTHIYTALQRNGMRIAVGEHNVRLTRVDEQHQASVQARELARRINALKRVDLFASFRDDEMRSVAESLVYTPFARGDVITRQGNIAHWLYILASGEADVAVETPEGRRVVSQLGAGHYFGEMGLMTGEPRTASVIARSDIECYRLDKQAFQGILEARPEIAEEMSHKMAARRSELIGVMTQATVDADAHRRSHQQILERIKRFFGLN